MLTDQNKELIKLNQRLWKLETELDKTKSDLSFTQLFITISLFLSAYLGFILYLNCQAKINIIQDVQLDCIKPDKLGFKSKLKFE